MKNNYINSTNLRSLMVVATFFSLWLASQLEESVENILAYVLILSFGIVHGANDIKLIKRSYQPGNSFTSNTKTLVYYIVIVLFGALLFFALPSIALALFILCSAYHFGEQHWNTLNETYFILNKMLHLCYGLFVLNLLFYFNVEIVSSIIQNIINVEIAEDVYLYSTLIFGISSLFILLFFVIRNKLIWNRFILELFYVIVFTVVFSSASLLWSFAIYFVFWHSIPSLVDQINFLYGGFSKSNVLKYFKSSFIYWLISIIGLTLIIYEYQNDLETALAFFFSVLAAITFPHVLVVNQMNKS